MEEMTLQRTRPPRPVPVPVGIGRVQVLHVATRYARGGSEARIRDVIRSFPEGDHHVVVGADSDVELAERQLRPATLTVVDALIRRPSPVRDPAALRRLASLLRRESFGLVVTHQSKAGVVGRVAARRAAGPPVIHSLSMASFGPGYPAWQDLAFRFIEARLEKATAAYVVAGDDLARRYAAIGVPAGKLHVVRSGVRLPGPEALEHPVQGRIRERFRIPDRPVVLYLGSLEPRKNVLDLGRYLSRLLAIATEARPYLVIAGEGPLAGRLRSDLRRRNLTGDASLVGFVEEPGALVALADAVVLLSQAEGVPQVLVQAAAVATPFVAYAVDGVRELIGMGAEGAAVSLGDVDGAAEATAPMLRNDRRRVPTIDLSSWSPEVITAAHRRLIRAVLTEDWKTDGYALSTR